MQQIIILIGCVMTHVLSAQSISIEHGLMHVYTLVQASTPFLSPCTTENPYWSLEYDHAFPFFNAGFGYLSYRPKTIINIETHPQSDFISVAQGSMLAHSPYLEINKPLYIGRNLKIQPKFRLHFAYVKKSLVSDLPRQDLDSWMWISFYNHPYTGFQMQPQGNLSLSFRLWKSLFWGLNVGYMQGFRKVHQLDVEYGVKKGAGQGTYQNQVYSQGTNWNWGMTLQYDFKAWTNQTVLKKSL